jgi:Cu+-exporting ATPase
MNMKSETLPLIGTVDEARAMEVARVLNGVNGVSKIAISTSENSVSVDFNDDLTSVQELRAALQKAGLGKAKPAHGEEGMCCGSCGS